MDRKTLQKIKEGKEAAIEVLLHNLNGPFNRLPRAAGWGYPEPYTRDLMISLPGMALTGNKKLIAGCRRVLETLARNQTELGHIPSLVHDPENRGASDTTPLFLLACGIFREIIGDPEFLKEAVQKSLKWIEYQSPTNRQLVAQQPTTDWRDEQWTTGYVLFVNTVVYCALRILGQHTRADSMLRAIRCFTIVPGIDPRQTIEGFRLRHKPYFAFWTHKIYSSDRFDLVGNSLAILSGIASHAGADRMISWIEQECEKMRHSGDLAVTLPPNFFPFIRETDTDWLPRYELYNRPGQYHNGGIWPFTCGFYIAALVAAGKHRLAEKKLLALTELVSNQVNKNLNYGFNEWYRSQDGQPAGQDWQTWSAAMYLYAAGCVETGKTPFFEIVRCTRTGNPAN